MREIFFNFFKKKMTQHGFMLICCKVNDYFAIFAESLSYLAYMKRLVRIILFAVVLLLAYMCVESIMQGLRSEKTGREMLHNLQENENSIL